VFGSGNQLRDFNYVDDVIDALLLAATSEKSAGQIFNLGSSSPVKLKNLAELLINVNKSGSYSIIPFPPERKQIDIGNYYGNFTKISSILGWKPEVSLEAGIRLTIEYYKKYGNMYWEDCVSKCGRQAKCDAWLFSCYGSTSLSADRQAHHDKKNYVPSAFVTLNTFRSK